MLSAPLIIKASVAGSCPVLRNGTGTVMPSVGGTPGIAPSVALTGLIQARLAHLIHQAAKDEWRCSRVTIGSAVVRRVCFIAGILCLRRALEVSGRGRRGR